MSIRTQTGFNYKARPTRTNRMKYRMRTRPLVSYMRAQTQTQTTDSSIGEPSLSGSEGCLHPAYADDNIIQGKQSRFKVGSSNPQRAQN